MILGAILRNYKCYSGTHYIPFYKEREQNLNVIIEESDNRNMHWPLAFRSLTLILDWHKSITNIIKIINKGFMVLFFIF